MQLRVINVVYLGRVDYSTALDLQQTLVHLVKEGRIGHTLLLLEHPPVITLGRNASIANVIASPDFLHSKGVELFETDRGGDVTFHGPGQLVGYPIFNLRAFSDLAEGELCDHDFKKKYNRPCEAIYGLFPGVIDLTFGQDEQVTGGHLSRWIFRLDAVYPLPFAPAFNIFGSVNTSLQKNVSTNALILPPTSTTPLGDPSVFIVNVDPRSRDLYRIGLGVNLVEIIKRASQAKTAAPQAKPSTTMKDVPPKAEEK